jgi:hypothetical protein
MALRRGSRKIYSDARRDVSTAAQWSAARRRAFEDGMSQLLAAMEGLDAVDERLRGLENELTDGEALALPQTETSSATCAAASESNLAEAALAIASTARRLNLRLGAVEQALDGHAALGADDGLALRVSSLVAAFRRDLRGGSR